MFFLLERNFQNFKYISYPEISKGDFFLLIINTYVILSISESIVLIFNYSDPSYSVEHWFITTGYNGYAYNVDIKLIIFEICLILIHLILIQIHKFRKILRIRINGSSDSNHSSRFTVVVVVAFTKKEKDKAGTHTHNLLLSTVKFVCESYLFYASCRCRFMKSMYRMSTSNFEYE